MSRGWRVALAVAVALSIAADFAFVQKEAKHFWEWKTFFAWFGLAGCVAIIVLSKELGKRLLQRPEGYYDEPGAGGERAEGEARDAD